MSKKKQSLKLPIFLIIGPALGLILSILLYAAINFIVASSTPDISSSPNLSESTSVAQGAGEQDLYGDGNSMFKAISNILLFLLSAGSMLAFMPCLVVGIIILNKRRNSQVNDTHTQQKESRDWGDLE